MGMITRIEKSTWKQANRSTHQTRFCCNLFSIINQASKCHNNSLNPSQYILRGAYNRVYYFFWFIGRWVLLLGSLEYRLGLILVNRFNL